MNLEVPGYLQGRVAEMLGIMENEAIYRENFATILRIAPVKDGDKWCVLYGADLHDGIAGFGNTPWEAMQAFHTAMLSEKATNSPADRRATNNT